MIPTRCPNCLTTDLCPARLRLKDFARLLVFQYPVRCRNCWEREYMFFHQILKIAA